MYFSVLIGNINNFVHRKLCFQAIFFIRQHKKYTLFSLDLNVNINILRSSRHPVLHLSMKVWFDSMYIYSYTYLVDKTYLFRIGQASAVQDACSLLGSTTATDQLGIWCRWGPMEGTAFSLCRQWPARGSCLLVYLSSCVLLRANDLSCTPCTNADFRQLTACDAHDFFHVVDCPRSHFSTITFNENERSNYFRRKNTVFNHLVNIVR